MSGVYSTDRPLFAGAPQTPLYKSMQEYAHKPEVQVSNGVVKCWTAYWYEQLDTLII